MTTYLAACLGEAHNQVPRSLRDPLLGSTVALRHSKPPRAPRILGERQCVLRVKDKVDSHMRLKRARRPVSQHKWIEGPQTSILAQQTLPILRSSIIRCTPLDNHPHDRAQWRVHDHCCEWGPTSTMMDQHQTTHPFATSIRHVRLQSIRRSPDTPQPKDRSAP